MTHTDDSDTPTPDEVKWQVRHNPLYKPKIIPDKKKKQSKNKCRQKLDKE